MGRTYQHALFETVKHSSVNPGGETVTSAVPKVGPTRQRPTLYRASLPRTNFPGFFPGAQAEPAAPCPVNTRLPCPPLTVSRSSPSLACSAHSLPKAAASHALHHATSLHPLSIYSHTLLLFSVHPLRSSRPKTLAPRRIAGRLRCVPGASDAARLIRLVGGAPALAAALRSGGAAGGSTEHAEMGNCCCWGARIKDGSPHPGTSGSSVLLLAVAWYR